MLIRPASNQKPYDNHYLADPAFLAAPAEPADTAEPEDLEAYAKAYKTHFDRMRTARETGRWADVTIEGRQPTKFVMRPIPGTLLRRLADKVTAGVIGQAELNALAFRLAIQSIENFGDYKVKQVEHEWLGVIASAEVVDDLDRIDLKIVNDLGADAYERARAPSPN